MSNPTANFGWVMPTATDLVTDLPADFAVFGQAVDTSMAGLLGGTTGQVLSKTSGTNMAFTWVTAQVGDITAVNAGTGISGGGTSGDVTITNSMATAITTSGDLIQGTGSGTFARLGTGTSGQYLTTNGTTLSWGSVSAGSNWSLLNAGGTALTGATTVTVSGISAKDKIAVAITGASAGASATISVRFNGDTGANYNFGCEPYFGSTVSAGTYITGYDRIVMSDLSSNAASTLSGFLFISGANASGLKIGHKAAAGNAGGGAGQTGSVSFVNYAGTSVISSVSIVSSSGNLDAGTVYIYTSA